MSKLIPLCFTSSRMNSVFRGLPNIVMDISNLDERGNNWYFLSLFVKILDIILKIYRTEYRPIMTCIIRLLFSELE